MASSDPLVQITRSGTVLLGPPQDVENLRSEFDRRHSIRLPQLLDAHLLQLIQDHLDPAQFYERAHGTVGTEFCLTHNKTAGLLHFLTNSPELFRFIEAATGCDRIGCFAGRVYRMMPGAGHYDSWHSDTSDYRMVGMSLNLSTEVFSGGVFQLRNKESEQILCEMPNTGPGDAILFRIAHGLQHQITPIAGAVPKTAFAGWFKSRPDYPFLPRAR